MEKDNGGIYMSKMEQVRKMLVDVLTGQRSKKKYMPVKDAATKIKQTLKDVDVYRTVYQLGLNDKRFDIVKDENTTYIKLA